ncbi:UDP-N-acetylmuramoyl-tripeptide--D-alanyl-D-alanine ligase [Rhizomicrobium palustre]|uniref:UDP-N-acetylmuramoyl-tripeptide--D-alanyl-D-alanine ligase n=1 Tax=Rhizomicrobium palustre TaxID=189966 RepID=A0A846MWA9_9PROT|nr:UDP-N-acetylmuramoyl-tripeptide--D-alanyl-D-alanine ligase [Rhizomicrobium palustre]NIK87505.1 UDP-N-acetylmuramoyl-tripeptide--D-alanyl-D-alanine ligase [Rhizomicrobium palustre]
MSPPNISPLWTSEEIERATLGRASAPFTVTGLAIDSRKLQPGELYVAIKGENKDGHEFTANAFENKAGAALVSKSVEGGPTITVAHTQRALEDLARAARARSAAKIIGVTGSAGKTTTKEILKLAFEALGQTYASGASFNNHWGVPFSLANFPREAAFGVFEIGMNHFGEIRNLVSFVRPHIALVTTIAPAHLEFFGNCEAIADAKSEIFEGLMPGGFALLPVDSPYCERLRARAKQIGVTNILTFGSAQCADARLISVEEAASGIRLKAEIQGKAIDAVVGAPGAHIASNTLGALLAVSVAGGDAEMAAATLADFAPLKGRGARIKAGNIEIIDESYNANPASMVAALALLSKAPGRKVAVLGDMLELGPQSPDLHAGLAAHLAAADRVFLAGSNMKSLADVLSGASYAANSAELAPLVTEAVRDGDTVLVKGSNGSRMTVVIDALKSRFGG